MYHDSTTIPLIILMRHDDGTLRLQAQVFLTADFKFTLEQNRCCLELQIISHCDGNA